ncbi:MAG: RagB/SusD family nutrient uptake outer membrane protein [Bacteroidia bacterium]|nr:RagB/SusD family nutrient uptake outer membrane protein [Bacteroidia bacterium]
MMSGDFLAGDGEIQWNGTFSTYREILEKDMVAENGVATATWIQAYRAINTANNVLSAVDVVDAADRDQVRGEALFLRGIMYFELVRLYAQAWDADGANSGPGVPLVLEPTRAITEADNVSRASIAEVYAQIIADLTEAKNLLPESNGVLANTFTGSGFLARVYLQQSNFTSALTEANRVIESGEYELNDDVTEAFFTNNSAEIIFEIQQNEQNNAGQTNNGIATFYLNVPGQGRADVEVLPAHTALYNPADTRLTDLIYAGTGTRRPGRLSSAKWNDPTKNYSIMRLAEMYLIRAEANFRLGSTTGSAPLDDINTLRSRANAPLLTNLTLDDIILERRLELAFEGHRVHDVKRLKGMTGSFNFDAPALVFPIPRREINANPNIAQNPGY